MLIEITKEIAVEIPCVLLNNINKLLYMKNGNI